ncbi:Lsr2 family protein [Agrococcus sp. Marseille-Q4369]|uniref:histone-like nucleoid-structuring protein Lsr2 n=1 Tax=Agrococcus sp. Marseille-Q4369 TaxID=2810513 RepID=UPI001B8C7889|nr:Lsr2 family protein [Agrococcus sp. Marseille-Q4369]QUW20110.1 Lsr2 family protein [Agrococcus sp. Marseille-Q4369]
MAKQTFTKLVDDFTGEPIEDGTGRTVRFAFDGAEYEIDLSNENIEELSSTLERYVRASRRVSGRSRGRTSGSSNRRSSGGSSSDTAAIREWAESQGLKVASRGRIPADVVERYKNR